ncbi:RNA polymerase sigma-70 factor [Arenibacter sp. F26102]|uniref:RNA polymerase sigma-70 factor n=1 Tax=Arenibacter sp. F26102 TaxID=2926416 RepID=UPI001FF35C4F|nr:RNA polymerase sigma-70 factor [Arenibacter sp. F26102]MCK0146028.1 RNA polymerase sigma-70 factor [Arenibacter sp. F26102]
MVNKCTDLELFDLMVEDNVLAFEEIYNRYTKDMFLFAFNIFRNREVCEDIVQNVFVDLWSKRKSVAIVRLKPYLLQSVRYQVFKHMRDRKVSNVDLAKLDMVDMSMNVSQSMEFIEMKEIIDVKVSKLPERCRHIFVLSRYQGKSNKEIALELGISNQAVKNQISKALKFIRQNLSPEEVFYLFIVSHSLGLFQIFL